MSEIQKSANENNKTFCQNDLSLFVFLLYFIAKPFYLFPSGGLQVADLCALLAIFIVILKGKFYFPRSVGMSAILLFIFVLYMMVVNLFWTLYLYDFQFLKIGLIYIYNFVLFLLFLHYSAKHEDFFFRVVAQAIFISVVIEVILSLNIWPSSTARQTISFNNPNQLAYWALLSGCIFAVCAYRVKFHSIILVTFFAFILYPIVLSASRAAIFGVVLLIMLSTAHKPRIIFTVILASIVTFLVFEESQILNVFFRRLDTLGEHTDADVSYRGYYRLWLYPEYLVSGAGEGAYERFLPHSTPKEFHSTIGTVLFSYGIIGLILFIVFLAYILGRSGLYYTIFLIPPFVYGIAHQGLRFSFLWLLFSAIAVGRADLTQVRKPPIKSEIVPHK